MNSVTLKSPAKINLYLKVIRRLPNGYHELVTVFHRISLFDTLLIRKSKKNFSLRCSDPSLSCGEDNLITRAYRLLQKRFPDLPGVQVRLNKKIPMGGGLGGGSGNAGSFLRGMKKLFRLRLSTAELAEMGKGLGADVPFFVYDVNQAIGTGLGDRIQPLRARRKLYIVLVLSKKGLSTPEVYKSLPQPIRPGSLTKASRVARILCVNLGRKNNFRSKRLLHNDLELSAFRLRPSIQEIIYKFHDLGILTAGMSGSGPSVFALFETERDAKIAAAKIRRGVPGYDVRVCHTF